MEKYLKCSKSIYKYKKNYQIYFIEKLNLTKYSQKLYKFSNSNYFLIFTTSISNIWKEKYFKFIENIYKYKITSISIKLPNIVHNKSILKSCCHNCIC